MKDGVGIVIEYADKVGVFAILMLVIVLGGYGYLTGKLPSPGEYKRIVEEVVRTTKRCDDTELTLDAARKELVESRVAHAAAIVRIEFLEDMTRTKDAELTEVRARVARLETELDVRRANEWRQSRASESSGSE